MHKMLCVCEYIYGKISMLFSLYLYLHTDRYMWNIYTSHVVDDCWYPKASWFSREIFRALSSLWRVDPMEYLKLGIKYIIYTSEFLKHKFSKDIYTNLVKFLLPYIHKSIQILKRVHFYFMFLQGFLCNRYNFRVVSSRQSLYCTASDLAFKKCQPTAASEWKITMPALKTGHSLLSAADLSCSYTRDFSSTKTRQSRSYQRLCCKHKFSMWISFCTVPQLFVLQLLWFPLQIPSLFFFLISYVSTRKAAAQQCVLRGGSNDRALLTFQYFSLKLQALSNGSINSSWNPAKSSIFFCSSQNSVSTEVSCH